MTEIKNERDLSKVSAKAENDYAEVALTSLTAYTLYWLHGWQLRRTIEAIAILNWRLFPAKFSMVGYPEYPDAFRTNRSLLQMQPKYRNLLTGAATTGFSLNARGMETAQELIEKIGVPTTDQGTALAAPDQVKATASRLKSAPRSIEPEREIKRLRESKLFEKWKGGVMGARDLIHVHAMLGIFDHTPANVRKRIVKELERSAEVIKDDEIIKFLSDVRETFPQARLG